MEHIHNGMLLSILIILLRLVSVISPHFSHYKHHSCMYLSLGSHWGVSSRRARRCDVEKLLEMHISNFNKRCPIALKVAIHTQRLEF